MESLAMLARENPTFKYSANEETGQMLISGMGELHLEVLVNRLRRDMHVDAKVGKPRVSYRETVTAMAEHAEEFTRPIAGKEAYAKVKLRVEPHQPPPGKPHVAFANLLPFESPAYAFSKAVEAAVLDASKTGVMAGYPMINLKISLVDAAAHEANSNELAFEAAARIAFDKVASAAAPALMEPIMKVQVVSPEPYFGTVSGDLSRRRAVVTDSSIRGDQRVIDAQVPLREMFGYATELRSLTAGRGSWTMEPSHYEIVPRQLADTILGLA
jgi:elongation factor G